MFERFLQVSAASVYFGGGESRVCGLQDVSVNFERRSLSLIMGPSGSGKTTLLSVLGCLLSPDSGEVFVDNVAVHALSEREKTTLRREKIGFVFQAFRLLRSLSALDNVMVGFEIRGNASAEQVVTAKSLLSSFGLERKIYREPDELSPGEKQRVAVARALVGNPPIILADEPTASLDAEAGKNICKLLREQVDQHGRTVVVVTHDPRWQEFADQTVALSFGQVAVAQGVAQS